MFSLYLNILINASEALAPGTETLLDVRFLGSKRVEVSVRDHGAGLSAGQLARVGEPFYSSKPGGTGLGLSISRKIALAHGGDLHVESAQGEGTIVRVSLPTS